MSNKLDGIKDNEIKVFLKDVNFDFDVSKDNPLGAHIHYTTGAASLMDEAFLFKSNDGELSQEELEIIKKFKKEDEMDEQIKKDLEAKEVENADLKKQLEDIQKQVESDKVEKSLVDFELEDDLVKDVVKVMVELDKDAQETIVKAFAVLKEFVKVEENLLQKELETEAGADGDAPMVEKSLVDKIKEARKIEEKE